VQRLHQRSLRLQEEASLLRQCAARNACKATAGCGVAGAGCVAACQERGTTSDASKLLLLHRRQVPGMLSHLLASPCMTHAPVSAAASTAHKLQVQGAEHISYCRLLLLADIVLASAPYLHAAAVGTSCTEDAAASCGCRHQLHKRCCCQLRLQTPAAHKKHMRYSCHSHSHDLQRSG
jgi:hypothetical protein